MNPSVYSLLERSFSTVVSTVHESEIGDAVSRLGEGLFGELYQKLTNRDQELAAIVYDVDAYGKRISELIYEHRSNPGIRFFQSLAQAECWALQITKN